MNIIDLYKKELSLSTDKVKEFLEYAPRRYKVYSIPKRTIGRRTIAQPSAELKKYQHILLSNMNLPVHHAAKAYRKNMGIKENAQYHSSQQYMLKMDFKDFFPSITPKIFWDNYDKVKDQLELDFYSQTERFWINKIVFRQPGKLSNTLLKLSIGAPSSPQISNFCLYSFDLELDSKCKKNNIYYSRYADDITFSTNKKNILFKIPSLVRKILYNNFGNKLLINDRKTVFTSKAHNRHVTGITINNNGNLSLGRKRKRYIKHLVHHYMINHLDQKDIKYLQGLLSFSLHIDLCFFQSLKIKYGEDVIDKLMRESNE